MELNGHELAVATVRDLIRERASLGDRLLGVIGDEPITYAEADQRVNRIANSLRELGVEKGDVVATLMHNSVEHLCVWFACAKLGAIWAPFNIALVQLDLEAVLTDSDPRVIVVDAELRSNFDLVAPRFEQAGMKVVVNGDGEPGGGRIAFEALLEGEAEEPQENVEPSDPAGLIFTGGSTGRPKAVLVSNLWYFAGALRYGEMLQPREGDVHIGVGQLCHTIGSAVDVLSPVYFGLTTVVGRRFSASRFWDVARRHAGTITVLVEPVLTAILNQEPRPDDADNPIRIVATACGKMDDERYEAFRRRFDVDTLELYGQTETGPLGCINQRFHDRPHRSVGTGNGWAEIRIADPIDGHELPAEESGEILLRPTHPGTFLLDYYRQPQRFVEACRDLWFHTGDFGHLDGDGYLHFDGRLAHAIRRRGENIAAAEVEAVVLLHEAVAECAVVGVPAELGEEDVKVYVVPCEGEEIDPAEIVSFCEERIAYFKVPRYVELADDLPRSVTKNEIERYKLRDRGIGEAWDRERSLA